MCAQYEAKLVNTAKDIISVLDKAEDFDQFLISGDDGGSSSDDEQTAENISDKDRASEELKLAERFEKALNITHGLEKGKMRTVSTFWSFAGKIVQNRFGKTEEGGPM